MYALWPWLSSLYARNGPSSIRGGESPTRRVGPTPTISRTHVGCFFGSGRGLPRKMRVSASRGPFGERVRTGDISFCYLSVRLCIVLQVCVCVLFVLVGMRIMARIVGRCG